MKTVAIIGVGLMGGSLGIALRHISKNGSRLYDVIGIGRNTKKLQLTWSRSPGADTCRNQHQGIKPEL